MFTDLLLSEVSPKTSFAAVACMKKIASICEAVETSKRSSPLDMALAIIDALGGDEATLNQVWIARADNSVPLADGIRTGAWSFRFTDSIDRFEKPLIYFLRAEARGALSAAFDEATERGIFLNTAETIPSQWAKGVRPEIPLWLKAHRSCIPYDPASAQEASAIVQGALQALYVDGLNGCCYLTLHEEGKDFLSKPPDAETAFSGMYKVRSVTNGASLHQVTLCGAGKALHRVMQAADCLWEEWGVSSEVWSCPSYTLLAREGERMEQWNTLHPLEQNRRSRISTCLNDSHVPVIAVTDYGQHVAGQIGAYVDAPFTAIGADSLEEKIRYPSVEWIIMFALRALAEEGELAFSVVGQALHRYELKLGAR